MAQSFSVKAVLQAIDENFTSTTNKAMQMMNKLGATSNTVSNSVSKSGNSMTGTFKSVASGMGLVAVAGKAFDVIKSSVSSAVSRIDTLNNSNRTFANMNFSANQTKSAMNGLQASIKGLPTSLDSAVKGVQMIAASTGNLGKSQKVWSALNDAIIGFGGSTADVSNATIQLSQAFANGKIDGMTWISMMNSNMGPVLNAIAKQLGMTTGELKDGLSSGKISTKEFMDALINLDKNGGGGLKSLHQIAMDSTSGIGTAMENMKTAITRGVGKAILAFSDFSEQVTGMSIADIITNIGNVAEQSFNKIGPALQKIEPFFKSLFSTIQGLFNFINQNKDWLGPLTVSVVTFIGAFKGVQAAASGISSLITGFQNLQAFVQIVAGAKNSLSAFFTLLGLNPWVVLIAGIAAVVAGLVWFFTQTKTGQRWWKAFVDFLSNAWQSLVSIAQSVWSAIVNTFTTVVGKVKSVWGSITSFFSSLWQGIVSVAQSVWGSIISVFTTAWNGFIQAVSPIIDAFKNLWNSLTEFFTVLWQGIVSVAKTIWSGLSAFFSTIWQGIVAVATPIWNVLVAVITTVWNVIKTVVQTGINVISTVIQSVMTVIQAIWSAVWNVISTVAQTVWNMITTAVQTGITMISSIIQATLTIIQTVWSTIWNVIVTVVQTVWNMVVTVISTAINVVAGIIQAVTQAIQGNWSAVWNTIVSVATTVWNGIKSVVSAGINGVKSVITTVMNGLKSVISTVWNTIKSIFNAGVNFIKSVVHIDLGAQGRAIMDSFLNGLKSAWEAVKSFVGGIGSWIKKHKGPVRVDRKLLIPAGIAIMTGFNKGLQDQFETVKKGVASMAGAVSDAVSNSLETITVPRPDTKDFMNTMNALQSANQNLYRQHSVGFGGTFSDNLTIDSPTMAQENNSLLRKLADKQQDIYLDGDVLVGSTYDRYDNRLGNRVNLKGRWS
ncbi:tape measure protein [Lactobacillus salivarius]|uniref:tape measure protein n=1 Tax=Ligilactobacillus salivarius TaxID=1624 RepID=UPI00136C610C|nr:tape measure protein [Ligilactobacillus salivarius]MYZ05287.1 tape measure protein [Ligilactobacillus salivarius]